MVNAEYRIAYAQVLEILKFIPLDDYNKIPKEKIEIFEKYASTEYKFDYNPSKTLDDNRVSKIAKGVIAILYRNYWATDKQREKIVTWQKYERQRIEEEKKKIYNPDNIFKNKETIKYYQEYNEASNLNALPTEVNKNNIFMKVIGYLKKFLHID